MTAWERRTKKLLVIFCPMLFFHVSCLTTLEVLTASFHAMDEMLRSPNYERPLLALKQASWEVLRKFS